MQETLLAGGLALAIGVVLGMLGGGGAILTLPMLLYVAHVPARPAIATSLVVVGATSAVGAALHGLGGRVRWRVGLLFGTAAMAGAYGGGRVARYVPASVLLFLFAAMMLVTAVAMLRRKTVTPRAVATSRALGLGVAVGAVSGLVGAGGGFLVVPALALFAGLAMREAVGTSLFVIALQSFAGFAGQAGAVALDLPLVFAVTGCAVAGTVIGAGFSKRLSGDTLRRGFAWLVLGMGVFVIGKQL